MLPASVAGDDDGTGRHMETSEMLEEERKKMADKDEELEALHAQLANQKRALVQQLESIERVRVRVRVSACVRICVCHASQPA